MKTFKIVQIIVLFTSFIFCLASFVLAMIHKNGWIMSIGLATLLLGSIIANFEVTEEED